MAKKEKTSLIPPQLQEIIHRSAKPLDQLIEEAQENASSAADKEEIKQQLEKIYAGDVDMPNAMGFSKSKEARMYVDACRYYESGKYENAESIFAILCVTFPAEIKYPFGLAAAQHKQEKYSEALVNYSIAIGCDQKDPRPHMHSADCWRELGNPTAALNALSMAELYSLGSPLYDTLLPKIYQAQDELFEELNVDLEALEAIEEDPLVEMQEMLDKVNANEATFDDLAKLSTDQHKRFLPQKPKKKGSKNKSETEE